MKLSPEFLAAYERVMIMQPATAADFALQVLLSAQAEAGKESSTQGSAQQMARDLRSVTA